MTTHTKTVKASRTKKSPIYIISCFKNKRQYNKRIANYIHNGFPSKAQALRVANIHLGEYEIVTVTSSDMKFEKVISKYAYETDKYSEIGKAYKILESLIVKEGIDKNVILLAVSEFLKNEIEDEFLRLRFKKNEIEFFNRDKRISFSY